MQACPDFIIVGAPKAGTTLIYSLLAQRPDIYLPKNKEPYYFCCDGKAPDIKDKKFRSAFIHERHAYRRLFKGASIGQLTGEASTSYLYMFESAGGRIKADSVEKEPIIIGLLRDPVDRALSHYTYLKQKGVENLSVIEAMKPEVCEARTEYRLWDFDYVGCGKYYSGVDYYKKHFDSCEFFLFERIKNDLPGLMLEIEALLKIPHFQYDYSIHSNPSGIPRSPWLVKRMVSGGLVRGWFSKVMPRKVVQILRDSRDSALSFLLEKPVYGDELKEELRSYFIEDIEKLEALLQCDLGSWKRGI